MWINRQVYEAMSTTIAALNDAGVKHEQEARTLAIQNEKMTVMLDWSRVRINHLERQFAAVLYSKTNIELPIPKIEASPVEQRNPNMLPDFEHVRDDDPEYLAHPERFTTGAEPFPLDEQK